MTKAVMSIITLILILALSLVVAFYFVPMASDLKNTVCKESQLDEFDQIWKQLDYFESMNTTIMPASYNFVRNFNVKSCTEEIKYENGFVLVKWEDGKVEKMYTKAMWTMEDGRPLSLKEGTWDIKVSLRNVTATSSLRTL